MKKASTSYFLFTSAAQYKRLLQLLADVNILMNWKLTTRSSNEDLLSGEDLDWFIINIVIYRFVFPVRDLTIIIRCHVWLEVEAIYCVHTTVLIHLSIFLLIFNNLADATFPVSFLALFLIRRRSSAKLTILTTPSEWAYRAPRSKRRRHMRAFVCLGKRRRTCAMCIWYSRNTVLRKWVSWLKEFCNKLEWNLICS